MNDNPLPGRKRAVLIFISVLIIFSFTLISLQDWEDEDYLSPQEGICFGVKNIRSNVLRKFSGKSAKLKNVAFQYLAVSSDDETAAGVFDVRSDSFRIVLPKGNLCIFNPRC